MNSLYRVISAPMSLCVLVWASTSPLMAAGLNGERFSDASKTSSQRPSQAVRKPRVQILTEANHGSNVTLRAGDTLVVRLPDMGSTGSVWSLVSTLNSPVGLLSERQHPAKAPSGMTGVPGIHEFKFVAVGRASFERATYLKLLQLRPFEKGLANAKLWEIKVTVPAS